MITSNIKVLLVAALPPPVGGDSTWAEKYIQYSNKLNYSVKVVNTSIIGKRVENVNESISYFDEIKRTIKIWMGIYSSIEEYKPDIVHLNSNCSPRGLIRDYLSSCIIKRRKIPLIVHCHTNVGYKIKNSKLGNIFLKKLLDNAKVVIVLNEKSLSYVKSKSLTPCIIVPNFIETNYVRNIKRKINYEVKNIVYIGHVKKEKGIDEIVKIAEEFREIQFFIVGPITDDYINCKFNSNITVTGSVSYEKVRQFLAECDIFLFPTYSEGFSLALLEAMADGIPIIATDVGANVDMLEGEGGIIVEPQNTDMLKEAIISIRSRVFREKMSEWNRYKVEKFYTIERVMDRLRNLYIDIIDEKY